MTSRAAQPKRSRREQRIIERPRLIKQLDETDARTILLLAPAGYGKTTLARQWAKTLSGAVWVTLTAAHRDVAWLADDLANVIGARSPTAATVIREHINARMNPQRAARELGGVIAHALGTAAAQWLILDDYQAIAGSPEAEDMVDTIERKAGIRMLVASRSRPRWASGRRSVYGEVFEIVRSDLAMTDDEVTSVLRSARVATSISEQSQGWPAVIGLAAAIEGSVVPESTVPQALHRYLAEELFHRASSPLREYLLAIALQGSGALRPGDDGNQANVNPETTALAEEAEFLGFTSSDSGFELHPLLREFLLEKLLGLPDADDRVRDAIRKTTASGVWDNALALILRFRVMDLVEPTLAMAFKPLVRSGRLATLVAFAKAIQPGCATTPPAVQAVLAEEAFRDGHLDLAADLANATLARVDATHPLASRVAAIVGQIAFLQADFSHAEVSFRAARESATDARDIAEAAYGLATSGVFGEQATAMEAVKALRLAGDGSSADTLRYVASDVALRLLGHTESGLAGNLHLDLTRQVMAQARDPRARTNVSYTIASALTQRADYEPAREWLKAFFTDASEFGLEFAMPYAKWTLAQIAIGQRRFGEAEHALQEIEDLAARSREQHHLINARALRARLLLQNGEPEEAVRCVVQEPDVPLIPSWRAEYLASRALALACAGSTSAAKRAIGQARCASQALQARGLAQAATSVLDLGVPAREQREIRRLVVTARRLECWDPLVSAIRSAPALGDAIAADSQLRPELEMLYSRIGDAPLARRAGFRTRAHAAPREVLSPREFEVLGLIARGLRNREISRALFIADSTTKVHVRHILEKLGVHTRAEAAARLQMFDRD